MKQYDKIYVHCHSMQSNLEIVLEPGECGKSVKRVDNVLVMTIEEAKNMWERAVELFYGHDVPNVKEQTDEDFTTYLTSKGITL